MKKTVKLFAIIAIALSAISCSSIQNLFVKKQVLQKKSTSYTNEAIPLFEKLDNGDLRVSDEEIINRNEIISDIENYALVYDRYIRFINNTDRVIKLLVDERRTHYAEQDLTFKDINPSETVYFKYFNYNAFSKSDREAIIYIIGCESEETKYTVINGDSYVYLDTIKINKITDNKSVDMFSNRLYSHYIEEKSAARYVSDLLKFNADATYKRCVEVKVSELSDTQRDEVFKACQPLFDKYRINDNSVLQYRITIDMASVSYIMLLDEKYNWQYTPFDGNLNDNLEILERTIKQKYNELIRNKK